MTISRAAWAGKLSRAVSLMAGVFLALTLAGCSPRESAAARPEATLEELNAALGTWVMAKGRPPQSVSELTNFPALKGKRLPASPPGKKLAIDAGKRQVALVDN